MRDSPKLELPEKCERCGSRRFSSVLITERPKVTCTDCGAVLDAEFERLEKPVSSLIKEKTTGEGGS